MNEQTNLQIVKLIIQKLNSSNDLIKFVVDRPGHDFRYSITDDKIIKLIGPYRLFDFESAMDITIKEIKSSLKSKH
jgi:dTDP-glucose 4,6-dehydratase